MRKILKEKVKAAVKKAFNNGELVSEQPPASLTVEAPRMAEHGDWATNAAMVMARAEKKKPIDIAEIIIKNIEDPDGHIAKTEIAGPGFINFTLSEKWWHHVVRDVIRQGAQYGRVNLGEGKKVQVEFVSANPTGPLHVGHGRGAAVGDVLARVLDAAGFDVSREYYVNDAGRQMETLGRSVFYRYLQMFGRDVDFHKDLYQGDYIKELALEIKERDGDKWLDASEEDAVAELYPWAAYRILDGIKEDLAEFGVKHDVWFSEKSLYSNGMLNDTMADLKTRKKSYEEDGALWFSSEELGDDKDRVLIKSNGDHTYFASDIAYHRDKFQRGFDKVINIWGADHHGYVGRMKAAVEALGYAEDQLEVILVQLVALLRAGEPVAMSTRAGEFVTLKEVVDEVGSDAARFFFLTRSSDSGLDFDLELAKTESKDNPVYYVQYAHARICSVFKMAESEGVAVPNFKEANLVRLVEEPELSIMKQLAAFPDLIEGAADQLEPHRLTHYLLELAKKFHPYYNQHRFLTDDAELTDARLVLSMAVRQVVANGLQLLGVSAPEKM